MATAELVKTSLRLGTRGSLLAIAQSQQVADRLMAAHPGLQVELIKLQNRGDRDLSTPLSQVHVTDFFSDELDRALAAGEVDFCVHSWKDIDGPRPEIFIRAGTPRRALPHDVVVFRKDIMELIARGDAVRVGTSSQRRRINTGDFLRWALPVTDSPPRIEFHDLRGPVHERLQRIATSAGPEQLDGVVLALAGLERLWRDHDGRSAIERLLCNARWMVMPLSECPAAPAQGALALETLRDNFACRKLLAALHDPVTEKLVKAEQQLLADTAPDNACFGATAISDPVLGYVARLRGRKTPHAQVIYATRTATETVPPPAGRAWNAHSWQEAVRKQALPIAPVKADAVFVAHADACSKAVQIDAPHCWTSGPKSWARLAKQGRWVEGCADNLGFESVKNLLEAPVLNLPPLQSWVALTHDQAVKGWADTGIARAIPSYTIEVNPEAHKIRNDTMKYTHFYWSSARQYQLLRDFLPENAWHACGAGKTYHALRAAGLTNVQAFASRREWQQWLN